jgi:DNA-binding MarR family transcriptional regulator
MLYMQHKLHHGKKPGLMARGGLIIEMARTCVLMRTRLISRVITAIHDEELRPFGITSPQFVLLVVIFQMEPATRIEIGRFHHQDRSTLTRNLKLVLSKDWAKEVQDKPGARAKPIALTKAGKDLLHSAAPAWLVAQTRAKTLLGTNGVIAVMDIANGIMNT